MNALILSRTISTALNSPAASPKARTTTKARAVGSWKPNGDPRLAVRPAASMAAKPMTLSIERSMWPAMMQKERPIDSRPTKVACWRMLTKMPVWKKCGIVAEQSSMTPARMPQTRLSRTRRSKGAGPLDRSPSRPMAMLKTAPGSLGHHLHRGRGRLQVAPPALLVDVGLGDRRPRDLQVRAPLLVGELGLEADHVVGAGLQGLAAHDLGQEHGDAVDLGVGRLLDLDLLPALADVVEADRRPVARHHHDLPGLHALAFHDRDDRDGEV